MKNILFLMALVALFVSGAMAQTKATDFSGEWTLDVNKSKLGERSPIESMTMTVAQTEKELSVTTKTKRKAPPEGAPQGGMPPQGSNGQGGGMPPPQGGGGGMGGGRGMGGGMRDGTTTYSLDGKETTTEGAMGGQATLTAKAGKNGELKLSRSQTINGQMGEMKISTKETWQLGADGKTLTVKRESESPRGSQSSEMVFTKP